MKKTALEKFTLALRYFAMALISLIALLPFYVLTFVAFNHKSRPLSAGVFSLPDFTFDNITEAWRAGGLDVAITNSFIITVCGLLIVVLFGASAGYAIARRPTKFHRFWFILFLCCMMVPGIINTIPLYRIMQSINGINQLWSMILLLTANRLPFCIFLYTSFVQAMSPDIEQAAIIDGCTPFSAFWRITFPLLMPVNSTVIITSCIGFWNNYNQAVFFLQRRKVYTIPLAIATFYREFTTEWNYVAAAAFMGALPVIVVFLCLQKYFIKGLADGAVKG